jgi:DNA primase
MKFDIEGYINTNLERVRSTSTGELTAECPWCNKFGSFYVNASTGHYVCFKCDQRGRHLVGIVAQCEGISFGKAKTFILRNMVQFRRKETTTSLLEKIRDLRPHENKLNSDERIIIEMPEEFIPVYNDRTGKWACPSYLKARGVKPKTAKRWELGYCSKGKYFSRIIIPIDCPRGESFTARDATGRLNQKILNPPNAFHNQLLIGWKHVPTTSDMVLVEGPFDAIKMSQHGIPAIAIGGKVLHSAQLAQLFTRPLDSAITIMLDPEETVAPYGIANQLMCRNENVSIARLPSGTDPGDATKEQALEAYANAKMYTGQRTPVLSAKLEASRQRLSFLYSGNGEK